MTKFIAILVCATLGFSINLQAAGTYAKLDREGDEKSSLKPLALPSLAPLTGHPNLEMRQEGAKLRDKAFDYQEGRNGMPKDERKALLYFHLAAYKGNLTANAFMQAFCGDSKYGLTPADAQTYIDLLEHSYTPEKTSTVEADSVSAVAGSGEQAVADSRRLSEDGSDSTRRASDGAASGGAGSDSSDGAEGISVAGAGAAGVRHRKPAAGER